jgi:RNA polymerase sigma factor (TIGR02999 family)
VISEQSGEIATLMSSFRNGDGQAGARLVEIFYPELKRMAAAKLYRAPDGHSWQPTLLVNELYLQLIKIKALQPEEVEHPNDRAAFLALAGNIMKRLLIHHARPLAAKAQKVPLWDGVKVQENSELAEVESILSRLYSVKPILRTIVEMKVFEGRTSDEIARELGYSTVTIHRHWQFAKRWLQEEWGTELA